MKRNSLLDRIRKVRAKYIDIFIDNSYDLSTRIQYLMDVKGFDQKELAKKLNKNESEISKWMSGSHNYTIKTLAKIEEVLGSKLLSICTEEEYKQKTEVVIIYKEFLYNNIKVDKAPINIQNQKSYRLNAQKFKTLHC
ncbi:XRE family transcriptional regulator [Flavobacterium ranwuense]|uniref:XRE family transcriptional regulator n=1 Tax=Flavobacterium ranwuense TaxID=2541725 RepID=A0ABY2DMQ1_9FLAO|nr:helix-turn-helix transcriptional regulator [Flavobacterium ranwuense]TDE27066.1 XRE family transcriptional regulator [Flavobacterium ranwuense]